MKIKPFQALYPRFDRIDSPDTFCEQAKDRFPEFLENGLYEQFPENALYVYQIEDGHRKHTGLLVMNHVDDFSSGKIKKHEHTIREKERQQIDLFLEWKAMLKPVLLTYPSVREIENWLHTAILSAPPLFTVRFEKDGQIHRIWPVNDPKEIDFLRQLFAAKVPTAYIADGHHRTSTIALLREENDRYDFEQIYCVFIGADELDILDFNRVVEYPENWSETAFMAEMADIFTIETLDAARHPAGKFEIVMYLDGSWYSLRWKQEVLDRYPSDKVLLDTSLLNEHVLNDLLEIKDVRSDSRIMYIDGSRGLEGVRQTTDKSGNRIGFLLFPVSFDDMIHIADAGETLPPKSTYFEPRIRSGLMIKKLERKN